MPDADLLFMPATKAAALIRARKLSPVEYVDVVLAAVERAQPKLNCFRQVLGEEARRAARKAEEAVMRGETLGPLHGVPVSVKDLIDVAGAHTRHGSAIVEDNVAKADDVLVQRLRAAGAIVIGKSTTPEFGVKGL
ncbi:MAG: amidase family protein, partial [Reyranella sp.]